MTPERPASGPLRRPPQAVGLVGVEKRMPWGAIVRDFHRIEEISFDVMDRHLLRGEGLATAARDVARSIDAAMAR